MYSTIKGKKPFFKRKFGIFYICKRKRRLGILFPVAMTTRDDPVLAELQDMAEKMVLKIRSVGCIGLSAPVAAALQRDMMQMLFDMEQVSTCYGLPPRAFLQQLFDVDVDVDADTDTGRGTTPPIPHSPPPLLSVPHFDVQYTLDHAFNYVYSGACQGTTTTTQPLYTCWGTFVFTGCSIEDLPKGCTYVHALAMDGTQHMVTFPVQHPYFVSEGPRPCIWSSAQTVPGPWGAGKWCHIEDSEVSARVVACADSFWETAPSVARVFLVLSVVPSLIVARLLSPQDLSDLYECTGKIGESWAPVPASTWIIVGSCLTNLEVKRALVTRWQPDIYIANPVTKTLWDTVIMTHQRSRNRQLVLCNRPCISFDTMAALATACEDTGISSHFHIVHIVSMLDVSLASTDLQLAQGTAAFFEGMPHVTVSVLRNIVTLLHHDPITLWQ